jgi:hypothetical protein
MYKCKKFSRFDLATVALMVVCCARPATAGTQGAYMNSAGVGQAVDSISYFGATSTATSSLTQNPSAVVSAYSTGLPKSTPTSVYCQSHGYPNYVWSISCYVTGGASADNPVLDSLISLAPTDCAFY